ncbi:minor capsid protein [Oceanobacillus sp. FSL W7-1281]|uniref:minor capsid protein n=1 Tax=Oceanobacillus sp. FSL W7-1281 TaxID=2921698 RepID=UPI0030D7DB01
MIQYHLMKKLQPILPDLEWTFDYKTANDNTGTVYYEGGGTPEKYDVPIRYPRYMVYISSSDWDYAEYAAQAVYDALHKLTNESVTVEFKKDGNVVATKSYRVFLIKAASEPLPIGVEHDVMDYSVNFDVTLVENKEED